MKQYFACLKHAFTKKTLPMQTSILRLLFVVLLTSMCAPIWAVQDSTQYKALEQKLDSLDRELAKGAVELFRGQMWYLNHFVSICDSMSRGYLNEGILMEALKTIVSVHEPRFISMVNDLTDHQISLMRAVVDGVVRFSASDVIEKYRLNSSANVRRVKDALKKKEIITFNEKDEPVILDPLFEYWITKKYFGIA